VIAWRNRNLDRTSSRHRRGSNHAAAARTFARPKVIRKDGGLAQDCDDHSYYHRGHFDALMHVPYFNCVITIQVVCTAAFDDHAAFTMSGIILA
jgi:hypothetical protein